MASEILVVDRCKWINLLKADGSSSRTYYFTRENLPKSDVRKMDRVIGSFQDMVQERALELRKKMSIVTKEDLDFLFPKEDLER